MTSTKNLKKKLLKRPKSKKFNPDDFLSLGTTIGNLACTDRIYGGLVKGTYHNLVGDSDTGKSVMALTILAEAALDPNFEDYELVYNNAERAKLMDTDVYFPHLTERLVMVESDSPEEFYYDLDDRVKKGPVVYILDSMDSLVSQAEEKKFQKRKKAHKEGQEAAGSYGFKAKINSENLRRTVSRIGKNGSILVIISQTHDAMNVMFGPKKTRSGGYALKFYNRLEIWLSVAKTLTKTYKKKPIHIGTKTKFKVQKNHITGKKRTVTISVYNSYGIDDVGDCVDYLLEWEYWKKKGKSGIQADEFNETLPREELIKYIDSKPKRVKKLRRLVGKVWKEIEAKCELKRRPRYEAY